MVNIVAVMEFSGVAPKSSYVLRVKDASEGTTQEQMEALMDYIIANNILNPGTTFGLKGKLGCRVENTETTTFTF